MVKEKRDILVLSLVIVVVLLLAVLAYFFLINPAISGMVVSEQTKGVQYAILSIAQQAAACPTEGVPLTVGNATINLVALQCYQQQASAQETETPTE